jgi:site-specific DNA recombinase
LLTGLVVCGACGSRFTGTAATGRNATYRYYTCGGRQRYGTKTCSADRLPAEALDDAVVHSLLFAYDRVDLFTDAVAEAQQRARLGHDRHQGELSAIDAELAKVDTGIDRYLRAFETGTMPETVCGERVKALAAQSTALRARREQLSDEMEDTDLTAPTPEELSVIRQQVTEAVENGSSASVEALLQALVHGIRVDSRDTIHPTFRVPLGGDHQPDDAVRAPSRSVAVDLGGHNKNRSASVSGPTIRLG